MRLFVINKIETSPSTSIAIADFDDASNSSNIILSMIIVLSYTI
jgi:hypothetical protein